MSAVASDSFLDFVLEQMRLSSRLYPRELTEHLDLFENYVRQVAEKTVLKWNTLFAGTKPLKVESFIKKYEADLAASVKMIRDSFHCDIVICTLEDDVRKLFPPNNARLLGITQEEYYVRCTDDQSVEHDDSRLDYPHPFLIKTQKMRLCHLVSLQTKSDLANLQVLSTGLTDDAEDYVPLGWESSM